MIQRLSPELIAAASGGDPQAIAALLSSAQSDIRRYARRTCRTTSDVEDAVQETLIILYRRVSALRQAAAISGWLFTIVQRHCLRLAAMLIGAPLDAEASALDRRLAQTPLHDLRIDLAHAIESLPLHYRQVVLLRDVEELTIDEIAGQLETTRETVKARLHRGRAAAARIPLALGTRNGHVCQHDAFRTRACGDCSASARSLPRLFSDASPGPSRWPLRCRWRRHR